MRRHRCVIHVLLVICMAIALCSCRTARQEAVGAEPSVAAAQPDPIARHKGKVLVLLLGMDGCPGTARATEVLEEYAAKKPDGVSILRLDVPLPGENLKLDSQWQHSFPREVDTGRQTADKLEFFFYPTLYVFDKDGVLRYTGGCDLTRVESMVSEISGEAPGSPKKIYTLPMPAEGETAPSFSGRTLDGKDAGLATVAGAMGTMLVFVKTSCPFTLTQLPSIATIAANFKDKAIAVVAVNYGEEAESIKPIYAEHAPGVLVVCDEGSVVSKAYGVDVTPFFFLLDKDLKVVKRRSFTAAAATASLNALLGAGVETPRFKPSQAG